ncbi:MAG: type II toxin-antitoxin system HicA family toxin [Patescibacteria group bacterium]
MPNIPVITATKLFKVLKKKGFVLDRIKGSHHVFVSVSDQVSVSVPFHKGRDLGRGITRAILKDANITLEEFQSLL